MTRFLPGEMREAFQNSVPKSIPMTCVSAMQRIRARHKTPKIFIDD
jgi:hypothetical protein